MQTDQPNETKHKRFSFDPTINLGHVLTFVGLLGAMVVGWNTLDKRVVVLEEAKTYQRERDAAQDNTIRDQLADLKEAVRDVKRSVDKIAERQSGPVRVP